MASIPRIFVNGWVTFLILTSLEAFVFPASATTKLRVGIHIVPPFVMETNTKVFPSLETTPKKTPSQKDLTNALKPSLQATDSYTGISIEIWQQLATTENLQYDYFVYSNVNQAINELNQGKLDLLIGPIAITPERLQKVALTQPYYFSHPALLIRSISPSFWDIVHPFLQVAIIAMFAGVFFIHIIFSHLIWFAEHKKNSKQFSQKYFQGIWDAYWFTSVTMTTIGYGDKIPITHLGRILTHIWMAIGIVITPSITAALATGFTLSLTQKPSQLFNKPQDFQGQKVAVVQGSYALNLAKEYQMQAVITNGLDQAINLLLYDQVRAVLYINEPLQYYLHKHANAPLTVVPITSTSISYGMAVPQNSPLLQNLNVALLQMQQNRQIQTIINKYFY